MPQHNIKMFLIHSEGTFAVTPLFEFGDDEGFIGALFLNTDLKTRRSLSRNY